MRTDLVARPKRDQHAPPCIVDVQVRTKSWLETDGRFALGPHGFELLRAIDHHRSLAAAARTVGWSYRHAWDYLRQAEDVFRLSLVSVRVGKGRERGMMLSRFGQHVLRLGERLPVRTRNIMLKARSE